MQSFHNNGSLAKHLTIILFTITKLLKKLSMSIQWIRFTDRRLLKQEWSSLMGAKSPHLRIKPSMSFQKSLKMNSKDQEDLVILNMRVKNKQNKP